MSKNKNTVKFICLAGVMAAMYVGLDFLAVSVSAPFGGNLKISLSGLPVIIVSIFAGPLWGAATGFVAPIKTPKPLYDLIRVLFCSEVCA